MYGDSTQPGIGGFESIVLTGPEGTVVHVVPERGGIVTRFAVGGDELLALDEQTLADAAKNVRGGIPVLFPMAGRLPGDRYEARGRSFQIGQHGFARRMPWEVVERGSDGHRAWVECRLRDSEGTLAVFPWRFSLTLRTTLECTTPEGARLTLDARIENRDDEPMPHALGFHPYFRVPDALKAQASVRTDATQAIDNTTGRQVQIGKLDFTVKELDLHLMGHSAQGTVLTRADLPRIELAWSPAFRTLVLWTLAGSNFICVEPWEAPAGALATRQHLPILAPGQSLDVVFRMESALA